MMSIPTATAVIVFTIVSLFISLETNSLCRVKIGNSEFKGKVRRTWNGKSYCSFFGVPYAVQPKRFESSALNDVSWTGLKRFNSRKEKCLQYDFKINSLVGKEDCLYLDIHTDLTSSEAPVLVWLHGGTFNFGSGQEDITRPDGLIERGIVAVTVNYRLGPLGFFSYPHANFTKNLGLKDQVIALKWIKKYIQNFGGNSADVTLAGWSAGSAAVTYHLFSSASGGLFQKAIAMSGTYLNPWAFNIRSNESSISWCNRTDINCNEPNGLHLLQEAPLTPELYYTDGLCCTFFNVFYPSFIPVIEHDDDNMVIWEEPHKLIHAKPKNDVPLLIGYTSLEESCDANFMNKYSIWNTSFPNNRSDVHEFLEKLLNYEKFDKEKHTKFIQLHRISDMIYGVREFVDKYVENSDSSVYMYEFSLPRKMKKYDRRCIIDFEKGAFHGDDIILLFGQYFKIWKTFERNTQKPQKQMWDLWTNFIYYGDPTPDTTHIATQNKWPPYKENKFIMNIEETLSLQRQERLEMFPLWNLIYDCLYYANCDPFLKMAPKFLN